MTVSKKVKRAPLKVHLSLAWQRIVLTVRWAFRLPTDRIAENRADHAEKMVRNASNAMKNLTHLVIQLDARLRWYEANVPELKREYRAYLKHMEKAMKSSKPPKTTGKSQ